MKLFQLGNSRVRQFFFVQEIEALETSTISVVLHQTKVKSLLGSEEMVFSKMLFVVSKL